MLHMKQSSHFYTVSLAYETMQSHILQAQGVRRAWVGDYDTLLQLFALENINKRAVHINIIMW